MYVVCTYQCSACKSAWSSVLISGLQPQNCPKCGNLHFKWTNYDELEASGVFKMDTSQLRDVEECKIKID